MLKNLTSSPILIINNLICLFVYFYIFQLMHWDILLLCATEHRPIETKFTVIDLVKKKIIYIKIKKIIIRCKDSVTARVESAASHNNCNEGLNGDAATALQITASSSWWGCERAGFIA
jgi:hypothetical protein